MRLRLPDLCRVFSKIRWELASDRNDFQLSVIIVITSAAELHNIASPQMPPPQHTMPKCMVSVAGAQGNALLRSTQS